MDNTPKPARIPFTCSKCGKQINLTWEMFTSYYEGYDECMSCRHADNWIKNKPSEESK